MFHVCGISALFDACESVVCASLGGLLCFSAGAIAKCWHSLVTTLELSPHPSPPHPLSTVYDNLMCRLPGDVFALQDLLRSWLRFHVEMDIQLLKIIGFNEEVMKKRRGSVSQVSLRLASVLVQIYFSHC